MQILVLADVSSPDNIINRLPCLETQGTVVKIWRGSFEIYELGSLHLFAGLTDVPLCVLKLVGEDGADQHFRTFMKFPHYTVSWFDIDLAF